MKRAFVVVLLTAAAAMSGHLSAYAADMPPPYVAPVPALVPMPVYNWTGIYFGVNGGYASAYLYADGSLYSVLFFSVQLQYKRMARRRHSWGSDLKWSYRDRR